MRQHVTQNDAVLHPRLDAAAERRARHSPLTRAGHEPPAYATGRAFYALHAANLPAVDAAYRRGAAYLLKTQLEDGTWFVQTRAFGFQPYFETGFPHGRSPFISTVATSWAAVALSYMLD